MTTRSEPTPRTAPRRTRREVWSSWPQWWRRSVTLLVVGALVVGAAAVVALRTVRASLPQLDGEVAVAGLRQTAEVARDGSSIPELRARTSRDLFLAQGYAAAQDRFYAMDVQRRFASGTLAELWGADALPGDKLARTLGWRRTAQEELALLDPGTTRVLDAYAEGVNAWLADREGEELSLEYALLENDGIAPVTRSWEAVDSLAVLKAWAWSMSGSSDREVETALLAPRLGGEEVAELFPAYDPVAHPPVVTGGGVVDGVFEPGASASGSRAPRRAAPAWAVSGPATSSGPSAAGDLDLGVGGPGSGRGVAPGGSAVAVSGDRTESGRPVLVNDVLGEVSLPGQLSQVALRCDAVGPTCPYDVSGFALTGVPGVLVGRTAGLAWGLSSFRADTTDLFLERLVGRSFVVDGQLRPLRRRTEEIVVAGGDPFRFAVRSTGHGPLVSDVSPELSTVAANTLERLAAAEGPGGATSLGAAVVGRLLAGEEVGYGLATRWTGAEPGRTMDALLGFNRAADGTALREAAELVDAPTLGVVWADRESIGYQAAGRVPVRGAALDGRRVAVGWDPAAVWQRDPVPYAALPHTEDPGSGVLVAADQAPVGPEYPYDLGHAWDPGYRSTRLVRLVDDLVARGPVRAAALQATLDDTLEPLAGTMTPLLLQTLQTTAYASGGQDQLDGWDGRADADSAGAAYFQAVVRQVLGMTFDDEVRENVAPSGGPRWTAVLEELLADPDARWWDDVETPQLETRDTVLAAAQRAAVEDLVRLQAREPARWTWGHQHQLRLSVLGADAIDSALAGWLLEVDPYDVGGDGAAAAATGWDAREDFAVTSAPLARLSADLGDDAAGGWVALTGVSGHVTSRHLLDQTDVWHAGDLLPWPRRLDEAAVEDLLVLTPRDRRSSASG